MKKLLKESGRRFDRQGKGDHDMRHSPHTSRKFLVDGKIKSRDTANGVLKQAGLREDFLDPTEPSKQPGCQTRHPDLSLGPAPATHARGDVVRAARSRVK